MKAADDKKIQVKDALAKAIHAPTLDLWAFAKYLRFPKHFQKLGKQIDR